MIAIIIAAISQFVLGALWYSPLLFGKVWMKIMGADSLSPEDLKSMQKSMAPFYLLQLVLSVLFSWQLWRTLLSFGTESLYAHAFMLWLGFILPIQVGSVIWGKTEKKFWVKQILIMTSYQLVGMLLSAFIFSFFF